MYSLKNERNFSESREQSWSNMLKKETVFQDLGFKLKNLILRD